MIFAAVGHLLPSGYEINLNPRKKTAPMWVFIVAGAGFEPEISRLKASLILI